MRQPDETICFTCNSVIKRDVQFCPHCGASVAVSPRTVVHAPPHDFSQPASRSVAQQDVVGVGRYVLNFLLASFVGLILTYFLRNHGWLATWISAAVGTVALVLSFLAASAASP